MTDVCHIAARARAFEALSTGPGRAAEEGRWLDALRVLEALAAASPDADGGLLHLRIIDWLCRRVRAESPVATARRRPLGALADLPETRQDRAMLEEADLRGAGLWAASLRRSELSLVDLRAACLDAAALQAACLRNADIGHATFAGAILDGADLLGALPSQIDTIDLTPAQLAAAQPAVLPQGRVAGRRRHRPRPLPPLPG